jgi:hypothetical protein
VLEETLKHQDRARARSTKTSLGPIHAETQEFWLQRKVQKRNVGQWAESLPENDRG